jgi:hypothetical protein
MVNGILLLVLALAFPWSNSSAGLRDGEEEGFRRGADVPLQHFQGIYEGFIKRC